MALQIRRGTDVDRQGITPKAGEPIFTTDTKKLYIGDGTTAGGIIVDTTSGISNVVEDTTPQLGGNLDINNFDITGTGDISITGQISATSIDLKGSIFADDSTLLVDGVSGRIVGPVHANVTGNVTGDVTGNVTGNLTGAVTGSLDGTMTGSVFSDASSLLVDGINNKIVGDIDTKVLGVKTTDGSQAELKLTYGASGATPSTTLGAIKWEEGGSTYGFMSASQEAVFINQGGSGTGLSLFNQHLVSGGIKVRIDPSNADFTTPTNALEVVGTASATAFAGPVTGDITGSVYADNSTQIIDGVAGEIVSLTFRGETGNTPADTGTVDSWLEVSVNGATKYIPLYD